MLVIPAIDILDGQCVRLFQGKPDQRTVFSVSPLEVAKEWEKKGAKLLHLVDLNAAFSGKRGNERVIKEIVEGVQIPVQLGGGIRNLETLEHYLSMGVERVVLGTIAYENPSLVKETCRKFPNKILVALDAMDGRVAIKGWVEFTGKEVQDLAQFYENSGVRAIVYTDIKKDGTILGPNIAAIDRLARSVSIPLIASGGISSLEDIKSLKTLESLGVEGVIVGKALYLGLLDLEEAVMLGREKWE